ncbi:DEAD/DEAH box helicase [Acetobacterium sp.]|uniref:DEAD/DEAH box helicase n=1 Tax=Acetobacterium sp. TaxID=1872094 RepID=UPI00271C5C04|nr:DEAD/DEAH box helicase [Acetobacterium sp.]MDO9493948.1 DEAD/DEAH box helicase [Acetobacterium sp.]
MKKPDKQFSVQTIGAVEDLIFGAKSLVQNKYRETVNTDYALFMGAEIETALMAIPIERINEAGLGIRTAVICEAGVENMAQLLKMSKKELIKIQGVGERSAFQAMAVAQNFEDSLRKTLFPRLNPDAPTAFSDRLVKNLYCLLQSKEDYESCKTILDEFENQLYQELELARRVQNSFRWLFTGTEKKEAALQSLNNLIRFLDSDAGCDLDQAVKHYRLIQGTPLSEVWLDFTSNAAAYYALLEAITGVKADRQKRQGDLPLELVERVEALSLNTALMKSSLRGYQEFGAKYAIVQKNTLLGDEMGLGKTLEAIAAMAHLQAAGKTHFVVICPASVLINWYREIIQHSQLIPSSIHGSDREIRLTEWAEKGGVAVTTYETLKVIAIPAEISVDLLVADEAHYVKNPEAKRSQALYQLVKRAEAVLFMTGTPLENNLQEMSSLILRLNPEIAEKISQKEVLTNEYQFRLMIAPVYLRRNRDDVLNELPELIQKEQWVDFGSQEQKDYRLAVLDGQFMLMRRMAWTGSGVNECPKLKRLLEICAEAKENGRKILIFSFFRDVIDTLSQALIDRSLEPITGSVTPARRQAIIDDFGTAPPGTALICQIQAGGVGLNIQMASVVIICEPQIKPALETQAISRAYRMGQTHTVFVYRLLTDNSVDEQMMTILQNKQQLFDSYARDSVIAESSFQAVDVSEKSLIDRILAEERRRLSLPDQQTS